MNHWIVLHTWTVNKYSDSRRSTRCTTHHNCISFFFFYTAHLSQVKKQGVNLCVTLLFPSELFVFFVVLYSLCFCAKEFLRELLLWINHYKQAQRNKKKKKIQEQFSKQQTEECKTESLRSESQRGKRNRHVLSHQRCVSEPCGSFLFIHKVCFVQIKLWPGTEGRGTVADGRTYSGAPGDRNQVCQWQTSGEFE